MRGIAGIERGEAILARQGQSPGVHNGPLTSGPFRGTGGGGNSPVRQSRPIVVGTLAMWEADGWLTSSPVPILPEAPLDGQLYARQNAEWSVTQSFPEAPLDGQAYARQGSTHSWQPVATGMGVPEAPTDGLTYTRRGSDQSWQAAFTQLAADALYAPLTTVSFPEAPVDGQSYARRGSDHTWQLVSGGGGLPEAPTDGQDYTRRGSDQSWQLAFTQLAADALYAPLASPALTGIPTAPTAAAGNSSTQLATTAFVASNLATRPLSITAPGTNQVLGWNGTTWLPVTVAAGGAPGGANTQVQYNNSAAFGGSAGMTLNATAITGMVMGLGTDATGDVYYRNASGAMARLAVGSAAQVLQVVSGLPVWQTIATGGGTVGSGTGPQIAQYAVGTSTVVGGATLSGDATIAAGGLLTLANTAVAPGGTFAYPTSLTIDSKGRITAATAGSAPVPPPTAANPTAQVSGTIVNGTAATFMRSDAAPPLAPTAVTPGTYTYSTITVDQQGRLSSALSGTAPVAPPAAANPTATITGAVVNGVAATYMRSDAAPALATVNSNVGTFQGLTVTGNGLVTAAVNQNYAPLASPALTGTPTAPSATAGTNTTQLATTAFVATATGNYLPLVGGTLTGPLVINQNTAAPPPAAGLDLHINGTDNANAALFLDAHNNYQASVRLRRANGPGAAPAALVNGQTLATVNFDGWGATAYFTGAAVYAAALENWTDTAHGSALVLATTALGASLPSVRLAVTQGVQIYGPGGVAPPTGDLGPGTINASAMIRAAGPIESQGATARFVFIDNTTPTLSWWLYADQGSARIQDSTGVDRMTIGHLGAGTMQLNANVVPLPAPPTGTVLQASGANASSARLLLDSFGGSAQLTMRTSNGTAAAPSAVVLSQSLGNLGWLGYGATQYSPTNRGVVQCLAAENWSDTAQGTALSVNLTPPGSTTITAGVLTVDAAGNLTILGPTATKPGSTAWVNPSEARLKESITPYRGGLAEICLLQPISYRYNGSLGIAADGQTYYGLDAETTLTVMPELVRPVQHSWGTEEDRQSVELLGIDAGALLYALVNAVRQLHQRLATLEADA